MKKVLLASSLLGVTMFTAPFAMANGYGGNPWHPWTPPTPPPVTVDLPSCDTLCDPLRDDFSQNLVGLQQAINQIIDIDDANDVVQKAVNAGNLVDMQAIDGPDIILGTVLQYADIRQNASNLIDGGKHSSFQNLSQAATNVVNSISGDVAWNIDQNVKNAQSATNTILGGSGGYDADLSGDLADALTQTAVNASNLVDIKVLKNDIVQNSSNTQTAINTAAFESSYSYSYFHGFHVDTPDIYDLGQSATNVTNNVTVGDIDLSGACACGFEITQVANANQLAQNVLSTMGDVNNILQTATNVANSISLPTPPAAPAP